MLPSEHAIGDQEDPSRRRIHRCAMEHGLGTELTPMVGKPPTKCVYRPPRESISGMQEACSQTQNIRLPNDSTNLSAFGSTPSSWRLGTYGTYGTYGTARPWQTLMSTLALRATSYGYGKTSLAPSSPPDRIKRKSYCFVNSVLLPPTFSL